MRERQLFESLSRQTIGPELSRLKRYPCKRRYVCEFPLLQFRRRKAQFGESFDRFLAYAVKPRVAIFPKPLFKPSKVRQIGWRHFHCCGHRTDTPDLTGAALSSSHA